VQIEIGATNQGLLVRRWLRSETLSRSFAEMNASTGFPPPGATGRTGLRKAHHALSTRRAAADSGQTAPDSIHERRAPVSAADKASLPGGI
jgi:hypothetical protein